LVCHKFYWPGHKAAHCRTVSAETSSINPVTTSPHHTWHDTFTLRCFSRGILGHKSPYCPNKSKDHDKDSEKGKDISAKRKDKTPKQQSVVSLNKSQNYNKTTATLYGQKLPILLDTDAEITVVPEELVPPATHTSQKVLVLA